MIDPETWDKEFSDIEPPPYTGIGLGLHFRKGEYEQWCKKALSKKLP